MVELALDLTAQRQEVGLRVAQRLPRPSENLRVVAGDLQVKLVDPCCRSSLEPVPALHAPEQDAKGLLAPARKGLQHPLGVVRLRRKGVVEKALQVPAKLPDQVAVRTPFHPKAERRRHNSPVRALGVRQPHDLKPRRIAAVDVANYQAVHDPPPITPTQRNPHPMNAASSQGRTPRPAKPATSPIRVVVNRSFSTLRWLAYRRLGV